MRKRRYSYAAGWVAVTLVALVGFAAFSTQDPNADELRAEAAAASIGHTAGQYAGLSFAVYSGTASAEVVALATSEDVAEEAPAEEADTDESAQGTIVSTSTGWLSELEVRAFVEAYFEPADVNKAVRIAWCESRFDPNAIDHKTGGVGLFNHLARYWDERSSNAGFPGVEATDPEASTAAAAWEVYNGAGWEIFSCR